MTPGNTPLHDLDLKAHIDKGEVKFRSVTSRLIARIVMLAMGALLLLGSLHVWVEYQRSQKEFRYNITFMAENAVRLLSNAMWDIETNVVREQVRWLSELEQVGYVRVTTALTGHQFEGGMQTPGKNEPASVVLPILPPDHSGALANEQLGTLEIWSDKRYYTMAILDSTLRVVVGYVLYTALICVVVGWVMGRDLRRPLSHIARFAASLKPNELGRPLEIKRSARKQVDEIDLVVQGFQQLQTDLRHYIEHLDALVAERTSQLERLVDEVQRLSLMDALTGCYNRRALEERLPNEIQHCLRNQQSLCVVFADVDHFKRINDLHGHAVGDAVLREVALRFQRTVRSNTDWLARYGGEEFVIVLMDSTIEGAELLASRLRQAICGSPILVEGCALEVTSSFGVAQMRADEPLEELLMRADNMLYQAKREGRNRVCVSAHHTVVDVEDKTLHSTP